MIQKTERYSAQRHFTEIHNYTSRGILGEPVELVAATNTPKYLPRRVLMPRYEISESRRYASSGEFNFDDTLPFKKTRASFHIDENWGKYNEDEVFSKPYRWIQRQRLDRKSDGGEFPIELKKGDYAIVDMGKIEAGFITANITAKDHSEVVVG